MLEAAEESFAGRHRGLRGIWPFLGPGFVASVAYIDPGNFATNMASGGGYGYLLLWVVLTANVMAALIQTMSAKLGVATGRNLAEVCRERFGAPLRGLLWIQAELVAMATDLAEFIGAAIGLRLLTGVGLFPAALLTGAASTAILALQRKGLRRGEALIAVLIGVILAAFGLEVVMAGPSAAGIAHGLLPRFDGRESVLLAAGVLGATVMPHVIYLHSALTQHRIVGRSEAAKRRIFGFERVDVAVAMGIAGAINVCMLITAAAVFHSRGLDSVGNSLPAVDGALGRYLGPGAAVLFGVGLIASGLSSSSVGTMAGQVVMQGFVNRRIPLLARRLVTMLPSLVLIAAGADASRSLLLSQVVLSFGIPFAVIPLVIFCGDRGLMGTLVNTRATSVAAWTVAAVIVFLNFYLLAQAFA
jgi:manganese transport protein